MSDTQTDQASTDEIVNDPTDEVSATSQDQTSVESQNSENQDAVPANNEDASQSTEQPVDSELEKARKAIAKANIENRKLRREAKQRESAKSEPTPEPAAPVVAETEVTEEILYDPQKTAGFVRDTVKKSILEDREEQAKIRQQEEESKKVDTFWDKSDELAASDPEYAELADSSDDVQMSNILRDRLVSSEVGAKLHKHILSNPKDLLEINALSMQHPKAASDKIAEIEATLTGDSKGQNKKPNITQAPPPIDTAGSRSGAAPSSAAAGSMEDYYAQRMAEKAAAGVR